MRPDTSAPGIPKRNWTCDRFSLRVCSAASALAIVLLVLAGLLPQDTFAADKRDHGSQFRYMAGTENVRYNCVGTLQIGDDALTYKCGPSKIEIPYREIETMQYRADVTPRVRKMKVRWTAPLPQDVRGNKNLYFTLVYRTSGVPHVLILEVTEDDMRPYLAEIDLRVGRRVEVESHENYSP